MREESSGRNVMRSRPPAVNVRCCRKKLLQAAGNFIKWSAMISFLCISITFVVIFLLLFIWDFVVLLSVRYSTEENEDHAIKQERAKTNSDFNLRKTPDSCCIYKNKKNSLVLCSFGGEAALFLHPKQTELKSSDWASLRRIDRPGWRSSGGRCCCRRALAAE